MKRVFLLLMSVFCLFGAARADMILRMKKMVEVHSQGVLLGDLVEDVAQLPAEWAKRRVMSAPPAGEVSYHALTAIAYALSQYADMARVTLSGEPVISVSRKDRRMEKDEFHDPLLAYLKKTDPWQGKDLKVNILNLPASTRVPVGETTYRINQIDQKTSRGYSVAHVTVIVDGIDAAEVPVGLEIRLMAEVWVVARNLELGHILEEGDLRKEMHVVDATANHVSIAEDVVGFEMNRSMSAGTLLRSNEINKPLCAKRGDWVAINAVGNNLQISLRGKALVNGRLGDRVMCVNERSNRQVLVELTGMGSGVLVRL